MRRTLYNGDIVLATNNLWMQETIISDNIEQMMLWCLLNSIDLYPLGIYNNRQITSMEEE